MLILNPLKKLKKKLTWKKLLIKKCQKNGVSDFYYCMQKFLTDSLFYLYLHSLLTLKPNADKTAQTTKTVVYKCVSDFHFVSISGLGGSILPEKV